MIYPCRSRSLPDRATPAHGQQIIDLPLLRFQQLFAVILGLGSLQVMIRSSHTTSSNRKPRWQQLLKIPAASVTAQIWQPPSLLLPSEQCCYRDHLHQHHNPTSTNSTLNLQHHSHSKGEAATGPKFANITKT